MFSLVSRKFLAMRNIALYSVTDLPNQGKKGAPAISKKFSGFENWTLKGQGISSNLRKVVELETTLSLA